eukprot:7876684-Pyramimonas_sp.AAC.2
MEWKTGVAPTDRRCGKSCTSWSQCWRLTESKTGRGKVPTNLSSESPPGTASKPRCFLAPEGMCLAKPAVPEVAPPLEDAVEDDELAMRLILVSLSAHCLVRKLTRSTSWVMAVCWAWMVFWCRRRELLTVSNFLLSSPETCAVTCWTMASVAEAMAAAMPDWMA